MNSAPLISVSLLSADFARLGEEVKAITQGGADWIHFDVMDGHFVSALSFGSGVIGALRSWTSLPFDVHLMIEDPKIEPYLAAGAQRITFHPKAAPHPFDVLMRIRRAGCQGGLAITREDNPFEWPESWWPHVEAVTLMSVTPGASGQAFQPHTPFLLEQVRQKWPHVQISVDGGIKPATASQVAQAHMLVSGSFIFSHEQGYTQAIAELKGAALLGRAVG